MLKIRGLEWVEMLAYYTEIDIGRIYPLLMLDAVTRIGQATNRGKRRYN